MMIARVVLPSRLALIVRGNETLGYNPAINSWERLDEPTSEVLRWLRAGRERNTLESHLARRFCLGLAEARQKLQKILAWCIFRQLLYLDREPAAPRAVHPGSPLETVYWICTQACNLRCSYCYQDAMVRRPNELTTEEGKDLVDQVVEAGADTFIFTGGEPFTRRDLLEIARHSRQRGLRTNVITNGYHITAKNIGDVSEVFDRVTVSLDHGVAEYHDRHRGKGSWQRAARAVDLLLEKGVDVDVNSVLSRAGLKDLEGLMGLSRQRAVGQHRIIPQFPMGRGASAQNDALEPTEVVAVSDRLHQAGCTSQCEASCNVSMEGAYSTKRVIRNHCGAGLTEVSVDPEGWVYPCKLLQYSEFKTHNVRERKLVDIFNHHPILKKSRATVTANLNPCKTCIIRNHCGGGCRGIHFAFTHEYIKAHPLFCTYLRNSFEVQAWAATGRVPWPRRVEYRQLPRPPEREDLEGSIVRLPLREVPGEENSEKHERDRRSG